MSLSTEVQPGIFELPLLTAAQCNEILAEANSRQWSEAEVVSANADTRRVKENYRSSDVLFFYEGSRTWETVHGLVEEKIRPLVRRKWGRDFPNHSEVHVLRYRPGQFFKAHRDMGAEGWEIAKRYFTIVCYLNDDYEGGGTSFPDTGYVVSPETGKVLLFPADYLHQGDEIMSGEKYIAVTWLIDEAPMSWL